MRAIVRTIGLALVLSLAGLPSAVQAGGFEELGADLGDRKSERWVDWDGHLRLRGELLYNLDLDRGLTPSGAPLFPVPLSDPTAQTLTHADMRMRTDLAFYAPFGGVAVKVRLDLFDGLSLGSAPDGPPTGATGQSPEATALSIKRAWGEAATPIGVLAAGRMGSHWGLGILTHGGDCLDCDGGDAADRIAFVTPLFSHIWAVSLDFTAIGPTTPRATEGRAVDLDPADDVRTFTFAVLSYRTDLARKRRKRAGKTTVEYGAYVSHRWQDVDVPAHYVPAADTIALTPAQVVGRDFAATAIDGWLRITHPWIVFEAEGAWLTASYAEASVVPGVSLARPFSADQWGFALETHVGPPEGSVVAGLNLGAASGDPAPSFGVEQRLGDPAPRAGELDGPQASAPYDTSFDNFRFHPDYRIDRILFREIIGRVTDAAYLRPHVTWTLERFGGGRLVTRLALTASWALMARSTPGGTNPLGVEIDPSVAYRSDDGLAVELDYAVLFPLSGLDNPTQGLAAKPAQLLRLTLGYLF